MQKAFTTALLLGSSLCVVVPVQAQLHVNVGPQLGLNLATAHFTDAAYATSYRPGVAAGVRAAIGFGHIALEPALLFSQKGYQRQEKVGIASSYQETDRLNYVTLPLDLAYTQHANGQGVQVFAGPYVSLLLGGHYTAQATDALGTASYAGQIVAGSTKPDKYPFSPYQDTDFYSQRLDAGLQTGVGYRYGSLLVQASYSVGLRNLAVYYEASATNGPAYYNRAFQFSLSYLLGPKANSRAIR